MSFSIGSPGSPNCSTPPAPLAMARWYLCARTHPARVRAYRLWGPCMVGWVYEYLRPGGAAARERLITKQLLETIRQQYRLPWNGIHGIWALGPRARKWVAHRRGP